jgi:hypothetical protein
VTMGEGRVRVAEFESPVSEIDPGRPIRLSDEGPVPERFRPFGSSARAALTVVPLIRAIEIIRADGKGSSGILSACFPPVQAWPSERALRLRSFSA